MAKIREFVQWNGNVSSRVSEVECVYESGIVNGEKYVSFSTYGSEPIKNGGSASQVIHIDKGTAVEMIEILKAQFGL